MKKLVLFILVLFVGSSVALAQTFLPSRVKGLIHATQPLGGDSLDVTVVFPNLKDGVVPNLFFEYSWQVVSWLKFSPCLGWNLKVDEIITSFRMAPKIDPFWGWVDLEVRPQSWTFYWFVQAEWKTLPWLHLGVEEESVGDFNIFAKASHGGGPNLLIWFGKHFRIDLTVHVRDMPGQGVKADPYVRFHLFF